jgi:hypothetical protein
VDGVIVKVMINASPCPTSSCLEHANQLNFANVMSTAVAILVSMVLIANGARAKQVASFLETLVRVTLLENAVANITRIVPLVKMHTIVNGAVTNLNASLGEHRVAWCLMIKHAILIVNLKETPAVLFATI